MGVSLRALIDKTGHHIEVLGRYECPVDELQNERQLGQVQVKAHI